jgi:hypothetical protein
LSDQIDDLKSLIVRIVSVTLNPRETTTSCLFGSLPTGHEQIKTGEHLLDLCLTILPSDALLLMLESEQLPKLKQLFDIQSRPRMRSARDSSFIELTPRSTASKTNDSSLASNKSFLKQLTQSEHYSGRGILSYIVGADKSLSSALSAAASAAASSCAERSSSHNNPSVSSSCNLDHYMANRSHRDSVASNKSIQSEDSMQRNKIVLDEAINPKRPLRPSRAATTNLPNASSSAHATNNVNTNVSSSSPSISNQSISRPLSDGDEMSSTTGSTQQLNMQALHFDGLMVPAEEEDEHQGGQAGDENMLSNSCDVYDDLGATLSIGEPQRKSSLPPPPKPPKPIKMRVVDADSAEKPMTIASFSASIFAKATEHLHSISGSPKKTKSNSSLNNSTTICQQEAKHLQDQ